VLETSTVIVMAQAARCVYEDPNGTTSTTYAVWNFFLPASFDCKSQIHYTAFPQPFEAWPRSTSYIKIHFLSHRKHIPPQLRR